MAPRAAISHTPRMAGEMRHIVIIDDDAGVREAVVRLLQAAGLAAHAFVSAEDYLASGKVATTGVLISDIHLPGISGIELRRLLDAEGVPPHTIFITGRELPARPDSFDAAPCFAKPFSGSDLIAAVRERLQPA